MAEKEKAWRLGDDLRTYDSLLDGLTFDDLILAVHCGVKKDEITEEKVWNVLYRELLNSRMADMSFLLRKNMDKIIECSRDYYRDE